MIARSGYLYKVYNRFTKTWGTGYENVLTYNKRRYYYKSKRFFDNKPLRDFVSVLGTTWEDFLNQEIDSEIDDIWYELDDKYQWDGSTGGGDVIPCEEDDSGCTIKKKVNKYKSTAESTQLVAPTAQELADAFNSLVVPEDTFNVLVEYGGYQRRYIETHELAWYINEAGVISSDIGFNKEVVRAQLESDPWYYFANSRQMDYTEDSKPFQDYNAGTYDIPEGQTDLVTKGVAISKTNRLLGTTQVRSRLLDSVASMELQEQLMAFALMDTDGTFFEKVDEARETVSTSDRRHTDSKVSFDYGEDVEEIVEANQGIDYDGEPKVDNIEGEALKYQYTQKYKMIKEVAPDSKLISEMVLWYEKKAQTQLFGRPTTYPKGKYKEDLTYYTKDTIFKRVLNDQMKYIDLRTGAVTRGVTNSLFLNGMLRIKESGEMKKADFAAMLSTSLETDFKAEDPSLFEKIFAGAIIVLAIVVTVVSWGTGAPAMSAALAYGGMILSLGVLALTYFGGLSAQSLAKAIGAFAQIVGYASMILGVYSLLDKAGSVLASQVALEAGLQEGTAAFTAKVADELLKQTLLDQVVALVSQSLESVTSALTEFVAASFSEQVSFINDGIKLFNKGFDLYADHEKAELQKDIDELQKQEDEYNLEILNDSLAHPAAVYEQTEKRRTSYDALDELDIQMDSTVGTDRNYLAWNTNVNT